MSDAQAKRTPGWVVATVAGAFALLYAYAVWAGVAQLVTQVSFLSSSGLGLALIGWAMWILTIALPIALFAVAFAIGRKRSVGVLALLLLTGLTLVGVFWLDVLAYTLVNQASLIVIP